MATSTPDVDLAAARRAVLEILRILDEPIVPREHWPEPMTREQVDAWIADHDG